VNLLRVVVLLALCAGFVAYVVGSSRQLPERVATHFDLRGQPDRWMSRQAHVTIMAIFGLGFPALLIGAIALVFVLPASMISIPRREHWLSPERRSATQRYLLRHSFWLACMAVAFVAGLQHLVVEANRRAPPRIDGAHISIWAGLFILGTVAWTVALVRHFREVNE
jgi:uncharacterized membrane protein